ncbi:hypothetical protein L798_10300 [Zootermopsis nevadensis]|uniref:Uncharacterized protein n=1 Tax=Zootermopsis nevadensis TaxID=136037 RepID=A0A067R1C2_ZOONE|nr:hypothetical protein L798_10300 [Zootermopsis nevadensis]
MAATNELQKSECSHCSNYTKQIDCVPCSMPGTARNPRGNFPTTNRFLKCYTQCGNWKTGLMLGKNNGSMYEQSEHCLFKVASSCIYTLHTTTMSNWEEWRMAVSGILFSTLVTVL